MIEKKLITIKNLQKKICYFFKNERLLKTALTHSSYTNEVKSACKNNERLEFLGDAVISLVLVHHLFKTFPNEPEGELTKIRAYFACDDSLSQFAQSINLGDYLIMGKGEIHAGGRTRHSILEDAFEALAGAIYLDGGFIAAKNFIIRFLPQKINLKEIENSADYKTKLQEIVQQSSDKKIEYVLCKESGPDHDKVFEIELKLNSKVVGRGQGKSKKRAEQNAAKNALEALNR